MRKRVLMIAILGALVAGTAVPAGANAVSVERLTNVQTILPVRMEEDFPIASLMRATCSSLIRVERPDGSSIEIQDCQLTDEPVRFPENQGVPPSQAFIFETGPCAWHSDYWFAVAELDVLASSVRLTVTPSGHVHARSEYPASPLVCE